MTGESALPQPPESPHGGTPEEFAPPIPELGAAGLKREARIRSLRWIFVAQAVEVLVIFVVPFLKPIRSWSDAAYMLAISGIMMLISLTFLGAGFVAASRPQSWSKVYLSCVGALFVLTNTLSPLGFVTILRGHAEPGWLLFAMLLNLVPLVFGAYLLYLLYTGAGREVYLVSSRHYLEQHPELRHQETYRLGIAYGIIAAVKFLIMRLL